MGSGGGRDQWLRFFGRSDVSRGDRAGPSVAHGSPRPRELRAFFSCMAWRAIPGPLSKLQYFGYLMQRVDSLGKTLMLGGIGGRRRRG